MKAIAHIVNLWLGRQQAWVLFSIGLVLTALIGTLDAVTGPELAFSIFYLVPIAFVSWFTGRRSLGFVMSLLCAAAWVIDDRLVAHEYTRRFIPYWNAAIGLGFFVLFTVILVRLKNDLLREQKMATTDSLTGALNPRAFNQTADEEIHRLERYGHPFTFVFIDVDNFKTVNDVFGHNTGNLVLQSLVATVKDNIRITDRIVRLGGDEFGILLTDTDFEAGYTAVTKIQQRLVYHMQHRSLPVTFSMGAVTFLRPPKSVDEIIKLADNLMYAVKRHGKNAVRYSLWPSVMPASPREGGGPG
jgi:diguanylate cyclase (GGDEF)-like protein